MITSRPLPGDFIDIHIHDGIPSQGIFILESLMAHENKLPVTKTGIAYTYGIHPWFLNEENHDQYLKSFEEVVRIPEIIAAGEAGFDRLKGPSLDLQRRTFEEQAIISEVMRKPVIVHCVRGWDELLSAHKRIKPKMPWLIHGFRGNPELASQLVSKGFFLSFWFEFILRPESARLLKNVPVSRIFLETDGADVSIQKIYEKTATDLSMSVDNLKTIIFRNFKELFSL